MENVVGLIDNVVGLIIDMDGFRINKKFYCKELGLMGIDYEEALSFLFKIPQNWEEISEKDKKHCLYVIKHIY